MTDTPHTVLGIDFGTTNSVVARAEDGESHLVPLKAPKGEDPVFRSALCFWEDDGIEVEAGPWAIAEYLDFPGGSRFIQSFKSVAASPVFEHATVFDKRYRFEELGRAFLDRMAARSGGTLDGKAARIVVGRPVEYAGHRPDEALARQRYDAMFERLGRRSIMSMNRWARRSAMPRGSPSRPPCWSPISAAAPATFRSCASPPPARTGVASRWAMPVSVSRGIGSTKADRSSRPAAARRGRKYRSFDKVLEIPRGYFADFGDWSRLALMRNRKTLAELEKLRRAALDPDAIGRMIAIIEEEQGYRLYDAVGRVKRDLSSAEEARFRFEGGGLSIEADVSRTDFEAWIAPELARIEQAVDRALTAAATEAAAIDRVFLTGGTSLMPAIRRMFEDRFGVRRSRPGVNSPRSRMAWR